MKCLLLSSMLLAFFPMTASADQFCEDVKKVIENAPSEFTTFQGDPIHDEAFPEELYVFSGSQNISGTTGCTLVQQGSESERFSTSYTCGFENETIKLASDSFVAKIGQCLGVTLWGEQVAPDGEVVAVIGQYGLIRLSFTQQPTSIGFGVEVFRDENGDVFGSPKRGNRQEENGRERCTPKTTAEIEGFYDMYGAREGATAFEDDLFKGYTNRTTSPLAAFITKPSHQAHPALIVRDIYKKDGSIMALTTGDYAGDCEAFHQLLAQVEAMNDDLKPTK